MYVSGSQCFVIAVTTLREFYDDLKRYWRDREINSQRYHKLTPKGTHTHTQPY